MWATRNPGHASSEFLPYVDNLNVDLHRLIDTIASPILETSFVRSRLNCLREGLGASVIASRLHGYVSRFGGGYVVAHGFCPVICTSIGVASNTVSVHVADAVDAEAPARRGVSGRTRLPRRRSLLLRGRRLPRLILCRNAYWGDRSWWRC